MLFSSHQKKTKKAQPKWLRFFYAQKGVIAWQIQN